MLRGKVYKIRSKFWNKVVQSIVLDRDIYKIAKQRVLLLSAEIKVLQGYKNKSKEKQVMVIVETLFKLKKLDKKEDEANISIKSTKSRKEYKQEDLTKEQVKKAIVNIVLRIFKKDKIIIEVLEMLKLDQGKVTRLVNKDLYIGRASIKEAELIFIFK